MYLLQERMRSADTIVSTDEILSCTHTGTGWIWSVGSKKWYVSFAEYCLYMNIGSLFKRDLRFMDPTNQRHRIVSDVRCRCSLYDALLESSRTHSHTHTLSRVHSGSEWSRMYYSNPLAHTHIHSPTHSHTHDLTHSRTHTLTNSHTHAHIYSHAPTFPHSTYSHTHTLTHR